MIKTAEFSPCRNYRYELWRIWDKNKPYVMFIGLNPSTADEIEDDPTIKRCIKYAESWGYGGICMCNLFAYRATEPKDMLSANDPVGSSNDETLTRISKNAGIIVGAWGNHGIYLNRSTNVKQMLSNIYALKLNASGEPSHPLYQKRSLRPTIPLS
ncbi:DUF1643 domain-containing protein [Vibrio cholerae]|uniref:DUF1643 domain-containing protein n=1 Tax=Vibrio cholerae TaxID=666 RepID=UPI0011D61FA5|nr:DUF1643 domain-containing protein [Vibrio cholerae]TXY77881.1 DUF1643 domain-containing protein [Vibrio cholerae]